MKLATKIILAILGVIVILGILVAINIPNSHTANWDTEPVRINLPEGSDYLALKDSLETNGVLVAKAPAAFEFHTMARLLGLDKHVRPGSYLVTRNMKQLALVRKLRNGQQDPVRLTIGKFRTPQQLNDYLNAKLMHNDFNFTLSNFHLVLPDTYEFYWTVTPDAFMKRMEDEYNRFWTTAVGQNGELRCDLLELSDYGNARQEAIILASIVEEETNNNKEKPLIASVYLNRLKRGMPLQADPTVKYAVGDFTLRRILNKYLTTESPFNTYLHTGLPPAPICLPSKASINAVLNAPETNYLYFCASEQMDGTHRFAATLAEHNRNAARFHAALNARGIR